MATKMSKGKLYGPYLAILSRFCTVFFGPGGNEEDLRALIHGYLVGRDVVSPVHRSSQPKKRYSLSLMPYMATILPMECNAASELWFEDHVSICLYWFKRNHSQKTNRDCSAFFEVFSYLIMWRPNILIYPHGLHISVGPRFLCSLFLVDAYFYYWYSNHLSAGTY